MADGVILDGGPMNGLIYAAIHDGFVEVNEAEAYEELLPLRSRRDAELGLELLLLFEKAYLPAIHGDDFDYSRLEREGLVEILDDEPVSDYIASLYVNDPKDREFSKVRDQVVRTLGYLRPLIRSKLYRTLKMSGFFEDVVRATRKVDLPRRYSGETYYFRSNFVDRLIDLMVAGMGRYRKMDFRDIQLLRGDAADLQLAAWVAALTRSREEDLTYFCAWLTGYSCFLFDQSAMLGVPIVSTLFRARQTKLSLGDRDEALTRHEAFRLFKLSLLKDGLSVPRVDSVEDVLRLREHPQLRRFRRRMREFSLVLEQGDSDAVESVVNEIRNANAALRRIGPWRAVGRWSTYLSLPVSVAEALLALPIVGPALAAIGVGSQIAGDYSDLKHNWVLFGR